MYDDVEADFWKEIFVHVQHKNMIRTNAESLHVSEAELQFEEFSKNHPEIKTEIEKTPSYITWEIFITQTIKLRLFIQSQIKASLLQVNNGDLVKIADAKFPYNPFPEIEELLQNKEKYICELTQKLDSNIKFLKKQKLTMEIIKALLKNKFKDSKVIWTIEPKKQDFVLKLIQNNEEKAIPISFNNFATEINELKM